VDYVEYSFVSNSKVRDKYVAFRPRCCCLASFFGPCPARLCATNFTRNYNTEKSDTGTGNNGVQRFMPTRIIFKAAGGGRRKARHLSRARLIFWIRGARYFSLMSSLVVSTPPWAAPAASPNEYRYVRCTKCTKYLEERRERERDREREREREREGERGEEGERHEAARRDAAERRIRLGRNFG